MQRKIEDEERAQHGFFSSLPPDLQERIATNLDDAAFYHVGVVRFGTNDDEGAISLRLRDLPAPIAATIQKRAAAIRYKYADSLDFDHAVVTFSNRGVNLDACVYFPDGSTCGTAFSFGAPEAPELIAALPNHARLAALVKQLGSLAPAAWKELAAYQYSRVWPNDPPSDPKPRRSAYNRQADLDWLGRKAGIEYVADYYSHGGSPMLPRAKDRALPGPVTDQLNLQAVQHDQSWKRRDDGVYLVRNNRWYRDDRMEAPAPLLRRWLAARQDVNPKHQFLTQLAPANRVAALRKQLDWEAEVVTSLTRWQVENGLMLFMPDDNTDAQRKRLEASAHTPASGGRPGEVSYKNIVLLPFAEDSARIHAQYHTDVFYAGLSGAMRQALVEGRMPFGRLSQAQQREAIYLTPGLAAAVEGPRGSRVLLGVAPRQGPGVMGGVGGTSVRLAVTGEE